MEDSRGIRQNFHLQRQRRSSGNDVHRYTKGVLLCCPNRLNNGGTILACVWNQRLLQSHEKVSQENSQRNIFLRTIAAVKRWNSLNQSKWDVCRKLCSQICGIIQVLSHYNGADAERLKCAKFEIKQFISYQQNRIIGMTQEHNNSPVKSISFDFINLVKNYKEKPIIMIKNNTMFQIQDYNENKECIFFNHRNRRGFFLVS